MGENQEDIADKAASLNISDTNAEKNEDAPRLIIDEGFGQGVDNELENAAGEDDTQETSMKMKKPSRKKKKKKKV